MNLRKRDLDANERTRAFWTKLLVGGGRPRSRPLPRRGPGWAGGQSPPFALMLSVGERGEHQRRAEGHVALDIELLSDRLYLNAYVPNLQVGEQVVRFLCAREPAPGFSSPRLARRRQGVLRGRLADRAGVPQALPYPGRARGLGEQEPQGFSNATATPVANQRASCSPACATAPRAALGSSRP